MSSIISILTHKCLIKELRCLLPNCAFKFINNEADHEQLKQSEIVIADFDLLKPHLHSLQAKWIQGTWAGVDKIVDDLQLDRFPFVVTRFSGKHFQRLMSEYVISNIVNHERNAFQTHENNKNKNWNCDGKIAEHRTISDLTVGILGMGSIGNYIGKALSFFGAKIWGYGKNERSLDDLEYRHMERFCTHGDLSKLLQQCDYIVNVLPDTKETMGLLNGDTLKNCAGRNSVFINIGRGSIISENDLVHAIEEKWIAAAILDVFENEPLPKTSKLWDYKQIFITPHVAGVSRSKDIAEHFAENYKLYLSQQELPNKLIFGKGY